MQLKNNSLKNLAYVLFAFGSLTIASKANASLLVPIIHNNGNFLWEGSIIDESVDRAEETETKTFNPTLFWDVNVIRGDFDNGLINNDIKVTAEHKNNPHGEPPPLNELEALLLNIFPGSNGGANVDTELHGFHIDELNISYEKVNSMISRLNIKLTHPDDNAPDKMFRDLNKLNLGNIELATTQIDFDAITNNLSFSDIIIDSVFLNGDIPTFTDSILGGKINISDSSLLFPDSQSKGWFFEDTTYEITVDGTTVLTADLVNPFLFDEKVVFSSEVQNIPKNLVFDSEIQSLLDNIVINNAINSPYLDELQASIDNGEERFISIFSNVVSETNMFTATGVTKGIVWDDGRVKTPEPSAALGLFSVCCIGLGLKYTKKF